MKHHLRGEKLLSFLRLKYITEVLSTKAHIKNKDILLSLIVIASQTKIKDNLGNKIRYLKPDQIYYVKNNIQPEGVDISKLKESIANFQQKPLTLDFIHGLFESNSNNFKKVNKEDQNHIRNNFLPKGLELWKFKEYYLGLNHQMVVGPVKPLNVFKNKKNSRSFSSVAKNTGTGPMNSWFLTGFIDAEGCFLINIYKKKGLKIGWTVQLIFKITLHKKDMDLLKQIQIYFSRPAAAVGIVTKPWKDSVLYQVTSQKDLAVIIDHFDKYPLITQKWSDYQLFKLAFELVNRKEHLTKEGLNKLVAIKASMNLGLSESLKAAFPANIIPVPRPLVKDQEIKDPNWLAGFTTGEGCFLISISKSTTVIGYKVMLGFKITQSARDVELMKSLSTYLDCGGWQPEEKKNKGQFVVSKFSDNFEKIIPLFKKYPIQGVKGLDFADWCRAALIIKEGRHLTEEGLEEIREIKAGINKGREL